MIVEKSCSSIDSLTMSQKSLPHSSLRWNAVEEYARRWEGGIPSSGYKVIKKAFQEEIKKVVAFACSGIQILEGPWEELGGGKLLGGARVRMFIAAMR